MPVRRGWLLLAAPVLWLGCREARKPPAAPADAGYLVLAIPIDASGMLRVSADGQLVGGQTLTMEAIAFAQSDFEGGLSIRFDVPHDVEIVGQRASGIREPRAPLKAGGSRIERRTVRIPPDDIERRVTVIAEGSSGEPGGGNWIAHEVLTINPGGRPRVTSQCPSGVTCHDGPIPVDLEASAPLRPGATVDLVLRAVDLDEQFVVTLRFELPAEVQILAGVPERRRIPIGRTNRTEELTIRVKLPDDGKNRELTGVVAWEPPDPAVPITSRSGHRVSLSLQTLGN